ncbi:testis-expressed protein 10 homolog isoform X2 [Lycorma delicatula]
MVKTSHKRFVKKEKNKVKLKGNKLLPKGLNITDTTFKVKKIVIKEQLKEHGPSELLSRKKLNIKELVSRLNHHNLGMRQDALSGLKQVVEFYPEEALKRHLPELLEAAANLTIDRETVIRKDALKLLSAVLSQVTVDEMLPLFPVLSSYLVCAMTHIVAAVREDSLKLLDTLLGCAPQLVASQVDVLLPRFLDLISHKSGDSRVLSLHLEGKITTEKWRARVFYRLKKLLEAVKNYSYKRVPNEGQINKESGIKILKWTKDDKNFFPLYTDIYFQPATLNLGKIGSFSPDQFKQSKLKTQEYSEILIPLLLATFLEVAPFKKDNNSQNQHQIPIEGAILLQCIVDIILILWELLQECDDKDAMLLWFRQMYSKMICKRLVEERFPYTTSQLQAKIANKKWKKEISALLSAVEGTQNIDGQCLMQNLGLSQLVLLLTEPNAKIRHSVIIYLKNCLRNCGSLDAEQCCLLRNCLETVCAANSKLDSQSMLKSVTRLWDHYKLLDRPFSCMLFEFLTGVALNYKLKHLHSEETFEAWLGTLPELLTLPSISYSTVRKIVEIGTHCMPAFNNSLDGWIESILDNVVVISIEGASGEEVMSGKKDIISLLYWVSDWDEEIVKSLGKAVSTCFFGPELTSHLIDILLLRVQKDQEGEFKILFENEAWWQKVINNRSVTVE